MGQDGRLPVVAGIDNEYAIEKQILLQGGFYRGPFVVTNLFKT